MKRSHQGQAETVIRNYLIISGLYTLSTSLIWGVNTLFLLEAGLDILEVFIANAVFSGSMALLKSRPVCSPIHSGVVHPFP